MAAKIVTGAKYLLFSGKIWSFRSKKLNLVRHILDKNYPSMMDITRQTQDRTYERFVHLSQDVQVKYHCASFSFHVVFVSELCPVNVDGSLLENQKVCLDC